MAPRSPHFGIPLSFPRYMIPYRRLELDNLRFASPRVLAGFLCHFPCLEELTLWSLAFDQDELPVPQHTPAGAPATPSQIRRPRPLCRFLAHGCVYPLSLLAVMLSDDVFSQGASLAVDDRIAITQIGAAASILESDRQCGGVLLALLGST